MIKKLFLFLPVFFICSLAHATTAFVQYVGVSKGSSAYTSAATPAMSTTTGNAIIVSISESQSGNNVTSVTDTAGNTYIHGTGCFQSSPSNYGNVDIWYALNITGNAANVVTGHFGGSGSTYIRLNQIEVSGVAQTSAFEGCSKATANNTSVTTPSFSPATAGNMNVAAFANDGGTSSAGANYTILSLAEYRANAPAGAQTASISNTTTNNLQIAVATFKAEIAILKAYTKSGSGSIKTSSGSGSMKW